MKLALTGAHGVGKTTLLNKLVENQYLSQKVIQSPEIPRIICDTVGDKVFFRRGNNTLVKQSTILFGQVVTERKLEATGVDILLSDRTVADHWAYTLYFFEKELRESRLMDVYENFIKSHLITYKKIFYIPIEFPPKDDGIREGDVLFQKRIDEILCDCYKKLGINTITITGTVSERMSKVQDHM